MAARSSTPPLKPPIQPMLAKLNKSIVDVLQSADGRAKFSALSLDIAASTPQAFDAHLRAELEKWGKVVKAAGIKPE